MTGPIRQFQGDYRWLSNFWPCVCYWDGHRFPTVENAYQFSKITKGDSRLPMDEYVAMYQNCTAAQSKKYNREFQHAPSPDKVDIMSTLCRQKFNRHLNPELYAKLQATDRVLLEEGNYWGDEYWGVNLKTGKGLNVLGRTLMYIRHWPTSEFNFDIEHNSKEDYDE